MWKEPLLVTYIIMSFVVFCSIFIFTPLMRNSFFRTVRCEPQLPFKLKGPSNLLAFNTVIAGVLPVLLTSWSLLFGHAKQQWLIILAIVFFIIGWCLVCCGIYFFLKKKTLMKITRKGVIARFGNYYTTLPKRTFIAWDEIEKIDVKNVGSGKSSFLCAVFTLRYEKYNYLAKADSHQTHRKELKSWLSTYLSRYKVSVRDTA